MSEKEVTPALTDTLQALAELLPERVRAEMGTGGTEPWVYRYEAKCRGWKTIYWGGDWAQEDDLSTLEYALRKECEARGWYYSQHCIPVDGQGHGFWYRAEVGPHEGESGTPAHAFGLALLAALDGQK